MRFSLFVFLAAAWMFPSPGRAQNCQNADTQGEMTICASRSFEAADAEQNETYRALRSRSEGAGADKLVKAQRAWIAFRDAECAFAAHQNEGGSIHPMLVSICMEELTRKRVAELRRHLDCEAEGASCAASSR